MNLHIFVCAEGTQKNCAKYPPCWLTVYIVAMSNILSSLSIYIFYFLEESLLMVLLTKQ